MTITAEKMQRLANPNGAGVIVNEKGELITYISGFDPIPVGHLLARVARAQEVAAELNAAIENTLAIINKTIED